MKRFCICCTPKTRDYHPSTIHRLCRIHGNEAFETVCESLALKLNDNLHLSKYIQCYLHKSWKSTPRVDFHFNQVEQI